MIDGSTIVKQRQLAIRREMDRRGIALKIVAMDSEVPYSSLASYFPDDSNADPAQIPGGVIFALCGHIPADLLSLLLPDDFAVIRVPSGIDHDELADSLTEYLHHKNAAHHPDSPAGRDLAECERTKLDGIVAHLPVKAA